MSPVLSPTRGLPSGIWKGAAFQSLKGKVNTTNYKPEQHQSATQQTDVSPVSFPIGFTALTEHDENGTDVRVQYSASNYTLTTVEIHQDTSGTTYIDRGSTAWFDIAANDRDFQTGSHTFSGTGSISITFPVGFASDPNIVVWLAGFDISTAALGGWSIKTTASDVTQKKFTLNLTTLRTDSTIKSATVTWIAYPKKRDNIGSASFSTTDDANRTTLHATETLGLAKAFDIEPNVLVAFDSFDVGNKEGKFDIAVSVGGITRTTLTWTIGGGALSVLNSASATYLAIQNF